VPAQDKKRPSTPGVKELIKSRLAGESDDYILALAVEGGGMRGVVSGSILIALRELGIDKVFDRLYGSSAAALNLTQYAIGASWEALAVYYDYLPTGLIRKFPHNIGRPLLDMEYLDHVLGDLYPINTESLASSPFDVRIIITDVTTRQAVVKKIREDPADVIPFLKAGAWIPILSGAPFQYNGERYLDGSLLMAHPLYAAIDEGCTHVLAASPKPYRTGRPVRNYVLLKAILNRWETGLGDAYVTSRLHWDKDSAKLENGEVQLGEASVLRLAPCPGAHQVGRLTTDKSVLLEGARAGYCTTLKFFDQTIRLPHFTVATVLS